MADRKVLILRRLADEGEKAMAFYAGLKPGDWSCTVYSEGSAWTVREVLTHQVSAEEGFLKLAENILAGGPGAPADLAVDAFNEAEAVRLAGVNPTEALAAWRQARAALIRLVEGMGEVDFDRRGRHPFFGEASMEDLLKLVYRHNMIHAREVRRVLEDG